MNRSRIMTLALASCIVLSLPLNAQAFRPIMNNWQAYYNVCQPLVTLDCDACHMNGFDYNPYGDDLKTLMDGGMTDEEAFVAAEAMDSDGGGASNGQEIVVDCTDAGNPGDDPVVSDDGAAWSQIKALYR